VVPGRLENKVALITGGANGQGAAEARLFAEHGARVAVADIVDASAVAGELADRGLALDLDVADEGRWAAAVAATVERFGRIDVLVNNAGIGRAPQSFTEETTELHHQMMAVNADGVYFGMRAVVPVMKAHGSGSIVNISSIDGLVGVGGMMSYAASKFAVTGMTRTAALELGRHGIRVNSIHPGAIVTPMVEQAPAEIRARLHEMMDRQPIARMGTPIEVAYLALFLASDESSYCTGGQFVIDGGNTAGPYREGYFSD